MTLSINLTWNITDITRDNSDGFVTEIKYSITGVSLDSETGVTYTHVATGGYQVPDHTRKGDEIKFANLTESKVIEWVKAGMGTDEVTFWETSIPKYLRLMHDGQIGTPEHPLILDKNSSTGVPW